MARKKDTYRVTIPITALMLPGDITPMGASIVEGHLVIEHSGSKNLAASVHNVQDRRGEAAVTIRYREQNAED